MKAPTSEADNSALPFVIALILANAAATLESATISVAVGGS